MRPSQKKLEGEGEVVVPRGDCVQVIEEDFPQEYENEEVIIMYRMVGTYGERQVRSTS